MIQCQLVKHPILWGILCEVGKQIATVHVLHNGKGSGGTLGALTYICEIYMLVHMGLQAPTPLPMSLLWSSCELPGQLPVST